MSAMHGVRNCLLIDDDIDEHEIFSLALETIGYTGKLDTANNGHEALEKLKQPTTLPDLIFLDINMPRMNGIQCLAEIKSQLHLQHVPVVMYSTSAVPDVVQKAELLGAFSFIKKTDSITHLAEKLTKFFKQFI